MFFSLQEYFIPYTVKLWMILLKGRYRSCFEKKTPKFTTSMSEAAAPAKSWRRCFLTAFKRTDAYSVNWYFSASEATGSLGIP